MKPPSVQSSLCIIFLSISLLALHVCSDEYEPYSKCAPFSCGNITSISYPFWGNGQPDYCGLPGFRIDCRDGVSVLNIMSLKYHVIDINLDGQILRIARIDLFDNICPDQYFNTTLDLTLFSYTSNDENATMLYNCDVSVSQAGYDQFSCLINNLPRNGYFKLASPSIVESEFALGCNISVLIPVLATAVEGFRRTELTVIQVLNEGFEVRWIADQVKCRYCVSSGGRCGYNLTVNQFGCFCPDQAYAWTCPSFPPPATQLEPAATPSGETSSVFASISHGQDDACSRNFYCGSMNFSYPFWRDTEGHGICGNPDFKIDCRDHNQIPIIATSNGEFKVLSINQTKHEITIVQMDYWKDVCPKEFSNMTLNWGLFNILPGFQNVSFFYNCPFPLPLPPPTIPKDNTFRCPPVNNQPPNAFYATTEELLSNPELSSKARECERVDIPLPSDFHVDTRGIEDLMEVLKGGFNVSYDNHVDCRTENVTCPVHGGDDPNIRAKVGIGVGASLGTIILMSIGFIIYLRRKKKRPYAPSSFVSGSFTSDFSSRSDMEKGGNHLGIHLFTYVELEQATNYFDSTRELGEGGFGTVYHGKLRDGRAVAVKRLYENNYKRVEQFMNEVDILTRLRHQNLVSLYGCTSRHCRELLLVYEYIPNGTVADHLHGERAKPGGLPWSTRIKIAVETANALTYLHASDIIHRDVKTNNILLDSNFVVKVADFGLSRLFPLHVTHVSTAPQGTPGYVDPEYHECYQLTDKSDVYSLGVVLIELISSMPAVDITRHRHEINLSNLAINKIQSDALHELVDPNLGYESDYAVRKMINAVAELAFQCLQSAKELRPTMAEVLQTLKEIQTRDYDPEKATEMDDRSDDVGLLKSGPLPPSPDTVMITWNSSDTTPSTSG